MRPFRKGRPKSHNFNVDAVIHDPKIRREGRTDPLFGSTTKSIRLPTTNGAIYLHTKPLPVHKILSLKEFHAKGVKFYEIFFETDTGRKYTRMAVLNMNGKWYTVIGKGARLRIEKMAADKSKKGPTKAGKLLSAAMKMFKRNKARNNDSAN
ncbi:MAG: hypothetical protein AABW99_02400 [archaeon]